MFNRQLKTNIKAIDVQIGDLAFELTHEDNMDKYEKIVQKMEDLTKIRGQLTESKVKDSKSEVLVSGIFGLVGILVILNYEKEDVITSKAIGMATKMFKGG